MRGYTVHFGKVPFAPFALRSIRRGIAARFPVPRPVYDASIEPTASDRKTGVGCAIGRWPLPVSVGSDATE